MDNPTAPVFISTAPANNVASDRRLVGVADAARPTDPGAGGLILDIDPPGSEFLVRVLRLLVL
ncbi:hypothetical protein [Nocardia sp. NPDC051570]|uniref:hypothetical protein n=1 Tax=Nocardia sp. NPDC051570 TaxID=3364324 RepID=UPI00378DE203